MKPCFAFLAAALLAACVTTDVSTAPSGATGGHPVTATIPAKFQGTWTISKSGKHPTGGEGPTVIGATTWQGHESYGRARSVQIVSENEVTVTLAMTGEGEEWTDQRRLRLSPDGNAMTVSATNSQSNHSLYRVR